jgi:hypothetical protein
MIRLAISVCAFLSVASVAHANNANCWGHGKDDPDRYDISCTALTEVFLHSMQGATDGELLKAMDAKGRYIGGSLPNDPVRHFVSNYEYGAKGYGGSITFELRNGRVNKIHGLIDTPPDSNGTIGNMDYEWADGVLICSDFPRSKNRCD